MIYVNGMYRSGSTVIYNIVKHLIRDNLIVDGVHKYHQNWLNQPIAPHHLNLYSYRDVRTATASLMRRRGWSEDHFPHPALTTHKTAKAFMSFLVTVDISVRQRMALERMRHCMLRYETDIKDLRSGIFKIVRSMHLLLPEETIEILYDCHNIEAVKTYVDTIHKKEDKRTMYHPNHVSLEHTDYKNYMSDDAWSDDLVLSWLRENNYE